MRRVAERVRAGGHDVPEDVVRRCYRAGLRNFLSLYIPLAHSSQVLDNSEPGKPRLVATGNDQLFVHDAETGEEYRNRMSENRPSNRPLAERLQDSELILSAVSRGVREALIRHKRAGNPIAA